MYSSSTAPHAQKTTDTPTQGYYRGMLASASSNICTPRRTVSHHVQSTPNAVFWRVGSERWLNSNNHFALVCLCCWIFRQTRRWKSKNRSQTLSLMLMPLHPHQDFSGGQTTGEFVFHQGRRNAALMLYVCTYGYCILQNMA